MNVRTSEALSIARVSTTERFARVCVDEVPKEVYVSVDYEYLIWRGVNGGQERIRSLPRPAQEKNLAAKVNDSP